MKYLIIILFLISTAYGQNINYYFQSQNNDNNDDYVNLDSIFNNEVTSDMSSIKLAENLVVITYADNSVQDLNGRVVKNTGAGNSIWGNKSLILTDAAQLNLTYVTKGSGNTFFTLTKSSSFEKIARSYFRSIDIQSIIYSESNDFPSFSEISAFSSSQFLCGRNDLSPNKSGVIIGSLIGGAISIGSIQEQSSVLHDVYLSTLTDTTTAYVFDDSISLATRTGASTTIDFSSKTYIGTDMSYFTTNNQIKKLTDTSFVMVYMNTSDDYVARIGTITGTTIALGSEYTVADTISPLSRSYRVIAILSDTKIAVAYVEPTTNDGYVRVGTLSGTEITFGAAAMFNANCTDHSLAGFNNNEFIVFYDDNIDDIGEYKIASVSGTTITYY